MSRKPFSHKIKNEVLLLSRMVERAVMESAQALKDNDLDLSNQVFLKDMGINRKRFQIRTA